MMTDRTILTRLAAVLVLSASMAGAAWSQDKPPAPAASGQSAAEKDGGKKATRHKDRVFPKDLEGTWIATAYRDKLARTRSPRASASARIATAIKIQYDNRIYPILVTNFQAAMLQSIIDVQPDKKPGSYRLAVAKEDTGVVYASELSYIYFRGERDADGVFKTLSIAEPYFAKRKFVAYTRLEGDLEPYVNKTVIAGKYVDAQGRTYSFAETGEAVLPDRTFVYEVNLDPSAAKCDMLVSHSEREPEGNERIGFAWKDATLQLFEVTGSKAPLTCKAKPFAVLTRQ